MSTNIPNHLGIGPLKEPFLVGKGISNHRKVFLAPSNNTRRQTSVTESN
jgi:hypothetical protein